MPPAPVPSIAPSKFANSPPDSVSTSVAFLPPSGSGSQTLLSPTRTASFLGGRSLFSHLLGKQAGALLGRGEVLGEPLFAGLSLGTPQGAGWGWTIRMALPTRVGPAARLAGRAGASGTHLCICRLSFPQASLCPWACARPSGNWPELLFAEEAGSQVRESRRCRAS